MNYSIHQDSYSVVLISKKIKLNYKTYEGVHAWYIKKDEPLSIRYIRVI